MTAREIAYDEDPCDRAPARSRYFSCADRMCGAEDCVTCRGDAALRYRAEMAREEEA